RQIDDVAYERVADHQQVRWFHVYSERARCMTRIVKDVQLILAPTDGHLIRNQNIGFAKVCRFFLRTVTLRVERVEIIFMRNDLGSRKELQRREMIGKEMRADDKTYFLPQF